MKRRSFFYTLLAGVLVLLSLGAGSWFWIVSQSPLTLLQGGSTTAATAQVFVPKQAPLTASLLVNPTRLEALRQVKLPPDQRGRSRSELNKIKSSLLKDTGLDYQRDIQPWLGEEVTLAVTHLDIDHNPDNGRQVGVLLVAALKNPELAREVLEVFWQKQAIAGSNLVFEPYNGVELVYKNQPETANAPTPNLSTAILGSQFVLFANYPKVLRDALNNAQVAELNLRSSETVQQALAQLAHRRVGVAVVNLPPFVTGVTPEPVETKPQKKKAKLKEAIEPSPPPETVAKQFETVAIALQLNSQGLLARTALLKAPETAAFTPTTPRLTAPVPALQYIPASSVLVAAGTDLEQLWQQVQSRVGGYDLLTRLLNQPVTDLQKRWGLDLPETLFREVRGQYALALLPRPDRNQPDWIFVAQADPDAAAELGKTLDAIAQKQGYSIGPFNIGDRTIFAWTKLAALPTAKTPKEQDGKILKAQVQGVRTQVENYEIFTSSIEAMDEALKAVQEGSLLNNRNFTESIARLPVPNDGYFYLDWESGQAALEKQFPLLRLVELAGKPIFDQLRSLVVSSYGNTETEQLADIFLQFGKSS